MINRPVEEPDLSLTLKLTAHEMDMLTWLAQRAELESPAELVERFVADFTGSWRTNGSDEREMAFSWFNRCGYVGEHILATEATQWRTDEEERP